MSARKAIKTAKKNNHKAATYRSCSPPKMWKSRVPQEMVLASVEEKS